MRGQSRQIREHQNRHVVIDLCPQVAQKPEAGLLLLARQRAPLLEDEERVGRAGTPRVVRYLDQAPSNATSAGTGTRPSHVAVVRPETTQLAAATAASTSAV